MQTVQAGVPAILPFPGFTQRPPARSGGAGTGTFPRVGAPRPARREALRFPFLCLRRSHIGPDSLPFPLESVFLGEKPPTAPLGLPGDPSPPLTQHGAVGASAGTGPAGAAAAALLCCWIEEVWRQPENFGRHRVRMGWREGGDKEGGRGGCPRLHVMLRDELSQPQSGAAGGSCPGHPPVPEMFSCPWDVLSPQHSALGTPSCPAISPRGHPGALGNTHLVPKSSPWPNRMGLSTRFLQEGQDKLGDIM